MHQFDLQSALIYLGASFAAFAGVFARAARWTKPDGTFDARKAILELLAAPAIGIIAVGAGSYLGVDLPILGAIAALLGLLGPTAIEAAAELWWRTRFGPPPPPQGGQS